MTLEWEELKSPSNELGYRIDLFSQEDSIMETYPGELLVGVFPLVFCVDASLAKANGESTGDHRGQFDRFLDSMAGSLLDEPHPEFQDQDPANTPRRKHSEDGMMSLFRGEEGDLDSEAEEDMIFNSPPPKLSPGAAYDAGTGFEARPRSSFSHLGFPRLHPDHLE